MSGEKRATDHLEPAAKKRGSERQLTKDDASDDDDQPIEAGTFARASEDVIKQRKIVRARRGGAPAAAAPPAASNPFANVQLAPTGAAPAPAANPFAGISLQAPKPAEDAVAPGPTAAPAAEAPKEDAAKDEAAKPAEEEKKEEEAKPEEKAEEKKEESKPAGGILSGAGAAAGGFGGFAASAGGFGAAAGGGFGGFASSAGGLAFGSSAPAAPAAPSIFGSAAPTGTLLFGAGSGADASAPVAAPAPAAAELPPAGPVQTGEEGETTVFSGTAKLYHFNPTASEWTVRGVGPLKVNTSAENGRARLVMRQRDTLKLLLNANLWSGMNLAPMEGAANSWRFTCFNHAAAEDDAPPAASEAFAVRLAKDDSPVFEAVMKEHIPKKEGAGDDA